MNCVAPVVRKKTPLSASAVMNRNRMRIVKSVNRRSERSHPDGASTRSAPSRTVKLFAVEFSTTHPFKVPWKSGTNVRGGCAAATPSMVATNAALTNRLHTAIPYFLNAARVTFQLLAFVDDV